MTGTVDRPVVLPQRRTVCLHRLDVHRPWCATRALQVGGLLVGVRTDSDAVAALLDSGTLGRRVPEADAQVHTNLTLECGAPRGTGRGLHLLYHDHEVVARRESLDDLLLDLEELLAATGARSDPSTVAVLASAVLEEDADGGAVVLLPASWHPALVRHQRRLHDRGLAVPPTAVQVLPLGPELVVRRSRGGVVVDHPVSAWGILLDLDLDVDETLRGASALASAAAQAADRRTSTPTLLRHLAASAGAVHFVGLTARRGAEVVHAAHGLAPTGVTTWGDYSHTTR